MFFALNLNCICLRFQCFFFHGYHFCKKKYYWYWFFRTLRRCDFNQTIIILIDSDSKRTYILIFNTRVIIVVFKKNELYSTRLIAECVFFCTPVRTGNLNTVGKIYSRVATNREFKHFKHVKDASSGFAK